MKSSFWVVCGVVLLCFGSVRCKRHFSDDDENFLDKTEDETSTEKEEHTEWQLYKARTVWNDLTNEIEKLSRKQKGPGDKCEGFDCQNGGSCTAESGNPVCSCTDEYKGEKCETHKCIDFECKNSGKCEVKAKKPICKCGDDYTGDKCEKLTKEKCTEKLEVCATTGGTCIPGDGDNIKCSCPEGQEFDTEEGCKDKCEGFDCQNGGSCTAESGNPVCSCTDEYKGEKCETHKCIDFECKNTGKCEVKAKKPICKCGDDYTGDKCEKLTKEKCTEKLEVCATTGGTCIPGDGDNIKCSCPEGQEFDTEEGCKDKCEGFDCQNGGSCTAESGNPVCSCTDEYKGEKCETHKCIDFECKNSGKCEVKAKKPICKCGDDYTGDKCEKLTKEKCTEKLEVCATTGGTCIPGDGDNIKCSCPEGQEFDTEEGCKDKCEGFDCQNGGSCTAESGNPVCSCTDEYKGEKCETHKCIDFECKNSGTCEVKNKKPICKCGDDYTGDKCEKLTKEKCTEKLEVCATTGGTCIPGDGDNIKCSCPEGQEFDTEEGCKDKCEGFDCQNGGSCTAESGNPVCSCTDEYKGEKCETHKCIDFECKNSGTCEVKDKKPICKCGDDYTGNKCEKHKCEDFECKNAGTCEIKDKKPICKCKDDYTGDKCEKHKCEGIECQNNGNCIIKSGKPVCSCTDEYKGEKCETHKCTDFECKNSGKCEVKNKKPICKCGDDYTGDKCEKLTKEKCKEKLEVCATTDGTCIPGDGDNIKCSCPEGKEFDSEEGCKDVPVNFCKEVCGEKPDVQCDGDETKKEEITCSCKEDNKVFDKNSKECKDDNCFTTCGITHEENHNDIECVGGPFGKVSCKCKEAKLVFDSTDKECKTDYCKSKCGGETAKVKCGGNKFVEDEVVCNCNVAYEEFDEEKKICKTNYCKKVCGFDERMKCEGDPYESKKTTDCGCDDDNYLFKNQKCLLKCTDNDDCEYGGSCEGKEGEKLCKCKPGTVGDKCEVIKDCTTGGKYEKCQGDRGTCVFKEGKSNCECPEGKTLYEADKAGSYCEATCKEDKDCDGSNKECKNVKNDIKLCLCKEGYQGEDCSEVIGCKTLEENCKKIGSKCIFDEKNPGKGKCECKDGYTYNREKNECQNPYCYPVSPCKQGECKYNDTVGSGFCECPDKKFYNYKSEKCEDLPDVSCLLMKIPCNQHERCAKGKCTCKYKVEKDEECKPKCSESSCFSGAKCADDGSCYCEKGKFYYNKKCQVAKCLNDYKTKCKCPPSDFKREKDGEECEAVKAEEACSTDCGYGLCIKKKNAKTESCKCFSDIAEISKGKCILKKSFCAGDELQEDDPMKCKCTGKYKQAEDGITCRLKTCDDDDVKEECAKKGGECEMNWKNDGYTCNCPSGYAKDSSGRCTDPCSIEKNIKACSDGNKFCYNTISNKNEQTGICDCPPIVTGDKCSEKADHVYLFTNIFVLKKNYEMKSGINKVLLSADLMKSMELTFSKDVFMSGYLYDFRLDGSELNCTVFMNFKDKPTKIELDKIKSIPKPFSKVCEECEENAILWPPNLLLSDKGLKNVENSELEFCSDEVKEKFCGKGTKCDKKNNKCICEEGFKVIEYSFKEIAGNKIQRCEDIDECALGIDSCNTKNTKCVNTFGSYKCVCKEGFKKKETPENPETDKSDCVDMCTPSPCKKGKCALKEKTFDCECQVGVTGSFCDREDANYKSAKHSTVVVGAVLGTLLGVVAIAVLYYIIKKRKRSGSEDFMPAARMDHAEMAERRGMRGVSNKAYE